MFFFCKTFLKQRHFVIIFSVFIHRWLMIVIKFNCFKSSFFSIQFWLANILMFRISSRILMMIVKICRIKTNTFYFSLFQNEKISLSIYHSSTHYYVMNSSLSLFIYFLFDFNFIFFFVDCLRMSIFFKKRPNELIVDRSKVHVYFVLGRIVAIQLSNVVFFFVFCSKINVAIFFQFVSILYDYDDYIFFHSLWTKKNELKLKDIQKKTKCSSSKNCQIDGSK